jgi:hypothetical protein
MAALSSFAGTGNLSPVNEIWIRAHQINLLDSFLKVRISIISSEQTQKSDAVSSSNGRICSCQILNLQSSNYDHRYVALLAEKTNNGNGTEYAIAKKTLQKEKKQLREMFYDKVNVVAEKQGTGSCTAMFKQLKSKDKNLQLYEILNADAF